MRAVLLGSSRPGIVALDTLLANDVDVTGVVTPPDEAGLGGSLRKHVAAKPINHIWAPTGGSSPSVERFLRACRPDFGLCVGWPYLLDAETLAIPRLGWFNIHSSLLPAYRGHAPLNWAIINGERELGATLHVIDEGIDTGEIVYQQAYLLEPDENVADALLALDPIYASFVERLAHDLANGGVPSHPMPAPIGEPWPKRTPEDGLIDWSRSAGEIVNLIRALAPPYPGAYTMVDGEKIVIEKARLG